MNKVDKKLLGYDVRPGHKGRTIAGQLLSIKGLYDRAVEVVANNLDGNDLKAAIFAIEQIDGKAKQKVDITTNGKDLNNTPIFVSQDAELKEMIDKLSAGE